MDVVDFGAGEPDFPTPAHVSAAAHAAIDANFTKYTTNSGTDGAASGRSRALRDGLRRRVHAVGDHRHGRRQAGAATTPRMACSGPATRSSRTCRAGRRWSSRSSSPTRRRSSCTRTPRTASRCTPSAILAAVTPRTRGIIINSPGNPTGALIAEERAGDASPTRRARADIWVVLDLCYEKLIYDPTPHNLPRMLVERMRDRAVICGSASKAYAMTGWRCGWALGPAAVIAPATRCRATRRRTSTRSRRRRSIGALNGPQECVTEMLDEYRRRRDQLCEWLAAEPRLRCVKPAGAFYLFPDASEFLSPDGIRTTRRARAGAAGRGAGRDHAWRSVRRAGLLPPVVRDVDGASCERGTERHPRPSSRRWRAGKPSPADR